MRRLVGSTESAYSSRTSLAFHEIRTIKWLDMSTFSLWCCGRWSENASYLDIESNWKWKNWKEKNLSIFIDHLWAPVLPSFPRFPCCYTSVVVRSVPYQVYSSLNRPLAVLRIFWPMKSSQHYRGGEKWCESIPSEILRGNGRSGWPLKVHLSRQYFMESWLR